MQSPQTSLRNPKVWFALFWLAAVCVLFFNTVLLKKPLFTRWDFWVFVPDLFDPPERGPDGGHAGWEYFPQRLDLIGVAAFILAGAWGIGHLVLRLLRLPFPPRSLERTVFAFAVGLSALSLITLGAGLMGYLSRPVLAGLLAAACLAETALRVLPFARGGLQSRSTPEPHSEFRTPNSAFFTWLILLPLGPFLLATLLGSLLPSTDFDVNEYHFQGPKEFFQSGKISFLEHNVYTSFPFATEMLTLLAMVLRDDWYRGALAGKCVLMCFGPLTALALFAAGRRWFGTGAGVFAAFFYLATPWTYRISTIAYAEGGLCFFLLAALYAVMLAVDRSSQADRPTASRQFLLAGLLAGSAMACKYPGLVSVVVPLAVIVMASTWRQPWRWSACGAFVLGVCITVGPWLVKNAVETGNPVYPLAYRIFGGRDWDPALNARWRAAHSPPGYGLESLFGMALDVVYRNTWVSPLIFALAPLAFFVPVAHRRTRWLWGYVAWLFLSCWLLTHRIDRFWVPLLPVATLLAGCGAGWWWSACSRGFGRLSLLIPVTAVGVFQLAFITNSAGFCGYNDFLRDLDEAGQVTANVSPEIAYLNRVLPRGSKVLSVGDAELFDAKFPVVYNTVFDQSIFETWVAAIPGAGTAGIFRDPAEIRRKLAGERVTHVYVNWLEILRYRVPGSYGYTEFVTPERFAELVAMGVLGQSEPVPQATKDLDTLEPDWRTELERWGEKLKVRVDGREAFKTFEIYPVAPAADANASHH